MTAESAARPGAGTRLRGLSAYVLALVVLKIVVGLAVLSRGFHGVSDDDFARVVIAQRFAEAPSLDPSGTSWLPLPFWLYGASMKLFGTTPDVARATALALGVAAVLLVFQAARVLGSTPRAALAGAAVTAIFPYSAYLGVATVPEAPAAALTVFGAAAAVSPSLRARWLGAGALCLATASRYEPWAVALAFAALSAFQAWKTRTLALLGPAALALAFPASWFLHGAVRHGDPLFFVARVAAYQAALGRSPLELGAALVRAPLAFVTAEPELVLGATAAFAAWRWRAPTPHADVRLAPFFGVLGAIALMLILGDARGSAPTHHGERALLPLWFGAALALGGAIDHALERPLRDGAARLGPSIAASLLGLFLVRPAFPRDGFAERTSELAIGESARHRGVDRLIIDAPDFGFFAVQASFGRPSRSRVLDDHDPRRPQRPDLLAMDARDLARSLRRDGSRWLALPVSRAALLGAEAIVRDTHDRFALLELVDPLPLERAGSAGAEPAHAGATVGR